MVEYAADRVHRDKHDPSLARRILREARERVIERLEQARKQINTPESRSAAESAHIQRMGRLELDAAREEFRSVSRAIMRFDQRCDLLGRPGSKLGSLYGGDW